MRARADEPTSAELWEMLQEQRREVQEQRGLIAALEAKIAALQGSGSGARTAESPGVSGRRGERSTRRTRFSRSGLLKGAAAGLAGLAAAELAGSMGAAPAAADNSVSGGRFYADDGSWGVAFVTPSFANYATGVQVEGTDYGVYAEAAGINGGTSGTGVYGKSHGTGAGLEGQCDGSGFGVKGECDSNFGVHGTSLNNTGVGGVGGIYGVWGDSPTSASGFGVHGSSAQYAGVVGTGPVYGVWGDSPTVGSGSGIGVYGSSANFVGVAGTGRTYGVWGKSDGDTGVYGSSATGVGGVFAGGQAPLLLIPSGTVGPPTTGIHQQGEVVVDANGVFWVCIAATTRAGTWKSLFSVVPIPNVRVLNTRPAHQIGPYAGPIANNTVLTLAVAGQTFTRSDGSQVTIPSTATGVIGNLTAADATGSCFLALVPHGASYTGVSSINFPVQVQGTGLANAFTGALSSDGMVDIYVGNCSSYTVNVIVDITGYIS